MASKRDKFRYELRHRFLVRCGAKGGTKKEFADWCSTPEIEKEIVANYCKPNKDWAKAHVIGVWQHKFPQTDPKQYSILGESCPSAFRYPLSRTVMHPDLFEDEDTEVELLDEGGNVQQPELLWISVLFEYATQDQFDRMARTKTGLAQHDMDVALRLLAQSMAMLELAGGNSSAFCADLAQKKSDAA